MSDQLSEHSIPENSRFYKDIYDKESFGVFLDEEVKRCIGINGNLVIMLIESTGPAVAQTIKNNIHPVGIGGKLGEDTFGIIFPDNDILESLVFIDRITATLPNSQIFFSLAKLQVANGRGEVSKSLLERVKLGLIDARNDKKDRVIVRLTPNQANLKIPVNQLPNGIKDKVYFKT
jgi:hypothetical protein